MTQIQTVRRASLLGAVVLLLASCAATVPGEGGTLQKVSRTCPRDQRAAVFIADDFSGSGRKREIDETRLRVIEDLVRRAVVCEGSLRVVAFSSGTSASSQVYDSSFSLVGATHIAKLRKAPKVIDGALVTIRRGLKQALKTVPNSGSDPVGIADLASEYIEQLNGVGQSRAYQLDANVLTDGVQNSGGLSLTNRNLTATAANKFARQVTAPPLPKDSTLTYSGIGKAAGKPLPSGYVRALKAFYESFCIKTGAKTCRVVTDYTNEKE